MRPKNHNQTRSDQTRPDQISPDQTRPDKTRPTRPGHGRAPSRFGLKRNQTCSIHFILRRFRARARLQHPGHGRCSGHGRAPRRFGKLKRTCCGAVRAQNEFNGCCSIHFGTIRKQSEQKQIKAKQIRPKNNKCE